LFLYQVQTLQKQTGAKPQKTPQGTQFTFNDPNQLKKFLNKSKSVATRDASHRKKQVLKTARIMRQALSQGNYPLAYDSLTDLGALGVRASSIASARLASRSQWNQFAHYLISLGEESYARVAKTAARLG
jgi:hypothetical protein